MNSHFDDITEFSQTLVSTNEPCIWVPSNRLVVHQVPVPSAPKRKWPELVPWMLEDKILQPPESMHFVIVGKSKDKLSVLVVAKDQIREWKNGVEEIGLLNYKFIPDYLALPWHSGLISIGQKSEHVLVRSGEFEGFSAPPDLAWHMLANVLQQSEGPLSLSISMPEDDLPEELKDKVEILHQRIDWQNVSFPGSTNLLKGDFALAPSSNTVNPWLKTAALFVLALILSFVTLNKENNRLQEEVVYLSEQNRSEFYSLFSGLTIRSRDIRATLESYISNRFRQRESLQSDAMQALTVLDRAMSACNCDLQSLTWANNSLELILPKTAASVVSQWTFEGYEKQINTGNENTLRLTLNQEYGR
ncbi:MAG: hypothetical protein COA71_04485 [SAR86 cluster bacterium]|uniref:GspL cytoplasmic actin-ATPase-like domain-containing protein n=1 Tax=SAR86 cluster bacterium TaxID=2030880 RepID=A0A2A5CFV9_9GAMM|nr:MAG: hypothetical protein COA71_04485 [SAR86 cluster bacterium]